MSEDIALIRARAKDGIRIAQNSGRPYFLGFLSPEKCAVCVEVAKKENIICNIYGGYDLAERVYIGFFTEITDDCESWFPFSALTFNFKAQKALTHRDFLGTLMSLGIERSTIGDIVIEKNFAVVFVADSVKRHIIDGIDKVGNTGVSIIDGFDGEFSNAVRFEEKTTTVSSMRADTVISAIINCSRNKSEELIHSGLVAANSVAISKPTAKINEKFIITVKGYGKFVISNCSETSKKGKIILKYNKYM